jgi:hypothetical protein
MGRPSVWRKTDAKQGWTTNKHPYTHTPTPTHTHTHTHTHPHTHPHTHAHTDLGLCLACTVSVVGAIVHEISTRATWRLRAAGEPLLSNGLEAGGFSPREGDKRRGLDHNVSGQGDAMLVGAFRKESNSEMHKTHTYICMYVHTTYVDANTFKQTQTKTHTRQSFQTQHKE